MSLKLVVSFAFIGSIALTLLLLSCTLTFGDDPIPDDDSPIPNNCWSLFVKDLKSIMDNRNSSSEAIVTRSLCQITSFAHTVHKYDPIKSDCLLYFGAYSTYSSEKL